MQIQKLGLEIRKIGSLDNLYSDVDRVLSNYEIPKESISTSIQVHTAAHALQKMLNIKKHLDVCTIRNISELCQISIAKERMNVYSSLHCMDWEEMTNEFRQMITAMILDDFRQVLNPETN